jgi:hypothetical protein
VEILLQLHSIVRWIIVAVSALAVIKFLAGWLRGMPFGAGDRGLMAAYSGLVDLNVALGIILLIWLGIQQSSWPRHRLEHAFTMIVALAIVHGSTRWRRKGDDVTQHRNSSLVVLASMLIIVAGVFVVNGWS